MALFKKTKNKSEAFSLANPVLVKSVIDGEIKPLKKLRDGIFSEKMLGDGLAISVSEATSSADIVSPVSGKIVMMFHAGNSYGIETPEGVKVLIHVGIDTVDLKGKGFTTHVSEGDKIKVGDKIATVDFDLVRKQSPSSDVIVVITSKHVVDQKANGQVSTSSILFEVR